MVRDQEPLQEKYITLAIVTNGLFSDYNKWQRRQQNREHGDNQPGIAEGEVEVEGIEGGREEQV